MGRRPILAAKEIHVALKSIWKKSGSVDQWFVGRYVIMPDHVHLFAKPGFEAKSLADWMKAWKSISARRIAAMFGIKPPVWQSDYFDHFVRSAPAYADKWEYVRQNPVRKRLCLQPDDWAFQGTLHELPFD